MGKNFDEKKFNNLITQNDNIIKQEIMKIFQSSREERIKILGESHSKDIEKRIFLQTIDLNWKSHIQYLEQLRQVIGLRSYGQRDPLIEYKKEAFDLFSALLDKLKFDYITILMNLKLVEKSVKKDENIKNVNIDPKYIGKKMRRNEPCFCGSGKKYKHCCGAL
jgi:preprotein translocase subunit SecA